MYADLVDIRGYIYCPEGCMRSDRTSVNTCIWVTILRLTLICCAISGLFCFAGDLPADDSWMGKIRHDHPRLFFNRETWPGVKARALGPERAFYDELRRMVDAYPAEIAHEYRGMSEADSLCADGTVAVVMRPRPREWGVDVGADKLTPVDAPPPARMGYRSSTRRLRLSCRGRRDVPRQGETDACGERRRLP